MLDPGARSDCKIIRLETVQCCICSRSISLLCVVWETVCSRLFNLVLIISPAEFFWFFKTSKEPFQKEASCHWIPQESAALASDSDLSGHSPNTSLIIVILQNPKNKLSSLLEIAFKPATRSLVWVKSSNRQ